MNSNVKKALALLLCALTLAHLFSAFVSAEPTPTSGTCGADAVWAFDAETRTLTISGTGEVEATIRTPGNLKPPVFPWQDLRDRVERLVIEEGITRISDYGAFSGFSALRSVELPEGLTSLGGQCFKLCTSLESVNLPSSLTEMISTFIVCSSLKQDMVIPESVTELIKPFEGTAVSTVVLPASMRHVPDLALESAHSLVNVPLREGIESFGGYSLAKTGIKTLIVPSTVTELGNMMCQGCEQLAYVSLPDGIREIPYLAFGSTSSALKYIRLPADLETIAPFAFNAAGFESITIPATVKSIGEGAFNYMGDCLKDVWFTGTEAQWNAVQIDPSYNDALFSAEIHFNAPPEAPHLAGDVDADGALTAGDARLTLRAAVGLEEYEAGSLAAVTCDANRDGAVTAADARLTLRAAVGLA